LLFKNFGLPFLKVSIHGTNIYSFYDEKTKENSFHYFIELVSKEKLKFKFEIEQI